MREQDPISVDFVIAGCGVAGLRAAVELAQSGARVLMLAKAELTESATEYAQGGIAAALSDEDEISLHEADTIAAGDGLCNPEAVRILVEEGPPRIQELIAWGTEFDRAGTRLSFTREAAHSRSRILHAHGDSTGREISRALFAKVRTFPNVTVRAYAFTTELLAADHRVTGLRFLDEKTSQLHDVHAAGVLLATGGLGQVYQETTNPAVATGDGMAIAYHAGATLSDMEFVQFHPTALCIKNAPRFLLSEALRGEGGVLRNADMHRFMKHYAEAGELAPRDVVARAIVSEMHKTNTEFVLLDMTGLKADFVRKRFPRIYSTCQQYGIDLATDLVPVRPAAHYAMGGVRTDLEGRTNIAGLFAAGETACTGVHGANRLASNSLLEGVVFGARAGKAMSSSVSLPAKAKAAKAGANKQGGGSSHNPRPSPVANHPHSTASTGMAAHPADDRLQQIRSLLWHKAGIIRNARDLCRALEELSAMRVPPPSHPSRAACELHNVWTVAQVIAQSALLREESRGSHYRSDFACPDDERFQRHSLVTAAHVTFAQ